MSDAVSRRGILAGLGAGLAALFGGSEAVARGSRPPRATGMQVYRWEGTGRSIGPVPGKIEAMDAPNVEVVHGLGTVDVIRVLIYDEFYFPSWVDYGYYVVDANTIRILLGRPDSPVRVYASR